MSAFGAQAPPRRLRDMIGHFGPGLVLTASVVGSGEVIATPALGARAGYGGLWLVLLACSLKLPLQLVLARLTIQTGLTPLRCLDQLPGPRLGASWFIWLWAMLLLLLNVQQGAMLGGVAQTMALAFPAVGPLTWAVLAALVTVVLVRSGSYKLIERLSMLFVAAFTFATIACVGFLQRTKYAVSLGDLTAGLVPHLDPTIATVALVVFAVTGIGTTEIILYPYWCLEKGYARAAGAFENSQAWYGRARGWLRVMHADALVSMAVYMMITVAFFLLGASVLHAGGQFPEGMEMVRLLSRMYTEVAGVWAFYLFLLGVFFALYSTLLVSTTASAQLLVDCLELMGVQRLADPRTRARWRRAIVTALPLLQLGLFLAIKLPVWMVLLGGMGQSLMLPVVAAAIVYTRYRYGDPHLSPSRRLDLALWVSCAGVFAVTAYGLATKLGGR